MKKRELSVHANLLWSKLDFSTRFVRMTEILLVIAVTSGLIIVSALLVVLARKRRETERYLQMARTCDRMPIKITIDGVGEAEGELVRSCSPKIVEAILKKLPIDAQAHGLNMTIWFNTGAKVDSRSVGGRNSDIPFGAIAFQGICGVTPFLSETIVDGRVKSEILHRGELMPNVIRIFEREVGPQDRIPDPALVIGRIVNGLELFGITKAGTRIRVERARELARTRHLMNDDSWKPRNEIERKVYDLAASGQWTEVEQMGRDAVDMLIRLTKPIGPLRLSSEERERAVELLGRMGYGGAGGAVVHLMIMLDISNDYDLRGAAAKALAEILTREDVGEIVFKQAVKALTKARGSDFRFMQEIASESLEKIKKCAHAQSPRPVRFL